MTNPACRPRQRRCPEFIKPQLATLRTKSPTGDYLHEIKYADYRVQLHLNKGKGNAYTRNGLDWTKSFSLIVGVFDGIGQMIMGHSSRHDQSELPHLLRPWGVCENHPHLPWSNRMSNQQR